MATAAYGPLEYCRWTRSFVVRAAPIAALSRRAPDFKNPGRTKSSIWCWSTSILTERRP
jgi:hypothetical protein